jgi:hypothetical protein
MKLALASVALFGSAAAFSPAFAPRTSGTALFNGPAKGAGGMFDTRDPAAFQHEDPRKSIGEAPSFEEYLKQRGNGPAAPAAAAPAAAPAAPPPAAPVAPAAPAPVEEEKEDTMAMSAAWKVDYDPSTDTFPTFPPGYPTFDQIWQDFQAKKARGEIR